jgi:hypothetical protein
MIGLIFDVLTLFFRSAGRRFHYGADPFLFWAAIYGTALIAVLAWFVTHVIVHRRRDDGAAGFSSGILLSVAPLIVGLLKS